MERACKKLKTHESSNCSCNGDVLGTAITNVFRNYFTNRNSPVFISSLSNVCEEVFLLCVNQHEWEALKTLRLTIVSEMKLFNPFIGKSPRYIPFFRPLYWKHYLIVRKLGFPIDVVWMILERVSITYPITKDSILKISRACLRQCSYLNKYYLPQMRQISNSANRGSYIWGETLIQKLFEHGGV